MEDDAGSSCRRRIIATLLIVLAVVAVSALGGAQTAGPESAVTPDQTMDRVVAILSPSVLAAVLILLGLSAFFSASEMAFFTIHRVRLRALRESGGLTGVLVATMMDHPGRLLTTVLVGNMIANVLISVLLPARVERLLAEVGGMPAVPAYVVTVCLCTAALVFFGEITPKIVAVRINEVFARAAVVPLQAADALLTPIRWAVLHITDFLFRVTRLNGIQAAPFITDEEFKSVLADTEAHGGVIEAEEGQMIQGILEMGDALVREILVPRPDVVALPYNATVRQAVEVYREHEYSRMPVFVDDLDHVTGILFAKDLLPYLSRGELEAPIKKIARPAYFVPETMTVRGFLKDVQRRRVHLAIVVDEYGGTEGIVTLEDALEEVVGEIRDEDEDEDLVVERLDERTYRIGGNLPLDDLSELLGVPIEDEEHETVAGFLMEQSNKVLEVGDRVAYGGAVFTVEAMKGKRASSLVLELAPAADASSAEAAK